MGIVTLPQGETQDGPQDARAEIDAEHEKLDAGFETAEAQQLQLDFTVGGKGSKQPTSSSVRLLGGAIDVDLGRQLSKGETVVLRVEARVSEIAFCDTADNETGQIVGCDRRQKLRILSVSAG